MSKLFELPKGESPLMSAYEAVRLDTVLSHADETVKCYEQYFVTAVPPTSVQPPTFDRISLVDPTIRTIVRATTAL